MPFERYYLWDTIHPTNSPGGSHSLKENVNPKSFRINSYHDPLSRFILIYKDMIRSDIVEHWQRSNMSGVFL